MQAVASLSSLSQVLFALVKQALFVLVKQVLCAPVKPDLPPLAAFDAAVVSDVC